MKLRIVFVIAFLMLVSATGAEACMLRYDAPVCASWTQADAVFLGKVVKIEAAQKSENLPDGAKKIRFQVIENFKGADNPTFALFQTEWVTRCLPDFKKGDTWIVFAGTDIVVKSFKATRGFKIEPKQASAELETLREIVGGKTATAIRGQIVSAAQSGRYIFEPVEIVVAGGGKSFTAQTDADGRFNISVPDGNYKVELKFPFRAGLKWDENLLGASLAEGSPTVFRYDVRLSDGDCHFGYFEASKKE